MKLNKLLLAWLVASTTLMLYSVATAQAITWCGEQFANVVHMKPEKVVACLEAGANPNATDEDGLTPLHYAAYHASAEMARRLLDAGANVNATEKYGGTPLHQAAFTDSAEVERLLREAGARE